ncbi:Cupin domain protein [Aspergillus sclerotialis]|uniref:Cupin domain protein n=1 Tax=Aspergillus sclerotialis TaxID=2070753 RepID=A0A3A2Z8F5_9EURO|nr:Cupin domain protein [Aspergillus sclerotialis]
MSLSVGRPDTLGMDKYHNRALPERNDSEYAIIPWMVDFAQIIRKVSLQIYHSRISYHEKLQRALQIEDEMDRWVTMLPERIKPDVHESRMSAGLREPKWARRQRLVLGIRYHNVRTLLFRPLLRNYIHNLGDGSADLRESTHKCLDSAKKTIEVIYNTYSVHTFFRCWWYNTTYVMFATATLLLPLSKLGTSSLITAQLLPYVEMTVEILEAMDECVVARKSVGIIKHYLSRLRDSDSWPEADVNIENSSHNNTVSAETGPQQTGFDFPEWTYSFAFPDSSFDGIAQFFDDLGGFPPLGA